MEDPSVEPKLSVRDLSVFYGNTSALRGVSLEVKQHEIFGIIGPANSGKTSFLRALNRMDLFNRSMRVEGNVLFNGTDVKRWRNAEMALRWTAAGLLEAQKTFRKLKAYRHLPILKAALQEHMKKAKAKSAIETIKKTA